MKDFENICPQHAMPPSFDRIFTYFVRHLRACERFAKLC
jgi:hypothetical protein